MPRRIGILLFENLSSDASLDWIGRAAASVISVQLSSRQTTVPVELSSIRDAESAKLNELIYGYYSVSGDELRLTAQVRDPAALKNTKLISAQGKLSAGLLPLVDLLARQVSPGVQPYVTKKEDAVRELFEGISAQNPEQSLAHVELALKADPAFGPAYLARTQLLLSRGDTNGAKAALAQASQYSKSFSDTDRAKLGMVQAALGGSRAERANALSKVVAATPTDLAALDALANLQIGEKNFPAAVKSYQAALKVEPGNIVILNSLAYAQAYSGDLTGALASVEAYRKLAPNDANVYDTLAEVYFLFGRFADAERNFVEANQRNKAMLNGQELYRAAVAAYLAGNLKSANDHFNQYISGMKSANDPLLPVRQAIWAYQTGDKSALAQLQSFTEKKDISAEAACIAHSQLAIWLLASDQRDRARQEATTAFSLAKTPASKNFAGLSVFLAGPKASAAEWKVRAERAASGQVALQRQLLGYALLLSGQYADAASVWKTIYQEAGLDAMGEPKVFLGYSYLKGGNKQEGTELMKTGVLPPKSIDPGVPSLMVPYHLALVHAADR